ncbi:hypothetical protein ACFSKW_13010 [Nonomuraea mangrovi]|uniref:Uncharacterized protein n=2 Tax=Nonomuraea TaxID=83681 RepID=A0ABW4SU65_9ACTN
MGLQGARDEQAGLGAADEVGVRGVDAFVVEQPLGAAEVVGAFGGGGEPVERRRHVLFVALACHVRG